MGNGGTTVALLAEEKKKISVGAAVFGRFKGEEKINQKGSWQLCFDGWKRNRRWGTVGRKKIKTRGWRL